MISKAWVVRGGNSNEIIDVIKRKSVIAFGWAEAGDCSDLATRDQFRARLHRADQLYKPDQLYLFACEIQIGDMVLSPKSATGTAWVGEITGEYQCDPTVVGDYYPHFRAVKWRGSISRDDMSHKLKRSTQNQLTVFTITAYEDQIERILAGEVLTPYEEHEIGADGSGPVQRAPRNGSLAQVKAEIAELRARLAALEDAGRSSAEGPGERWGYAVCTARGVRFEQRRPNATMPSARPRCLHKRDGDRSEA